MSARADIKQALVTKFKEINGSGLYLSNLYTNVKDKLVYWDEVPDYPYVCVTVTNEVREYLPGDFKWGTLNVPIWVYVKSSDSEKVLENIFTDIETVVDSNLELEYATGKFTEDMRILTITSDEGLMEPLRIGEILLQIRYGIDG
jgi:hypothetical protein